MSDQERISPYNINTISSRQVMRIKKNISRGIISWSDIKFSILTSQELYGRHWRRIAKEILGVKGLKTHLSWERKKRERHCQLIINASLNPQPASCLLKLYLGHKNLKKCYDFLLLIPVMEGTDIKKMCQMKLLTFAKWQSSENFLLSGLFIMAKGWDHFPRGRKKLLLY